MQHLEVSGAVRPLYGSLGVKGLILQQAKCVCVCVCVCDVCVCACDVLYGVCKAHKRRTKHTFRLQQMTAVLDLQSVVMRLHIKIFCIHAVSKLLQYHVLTDPSDRAV